MTVLWQVDKIYTIRINNSKYYIYDLDEAEGAKLEISIKKMEELEIAIKLIEFIMPILEVKNIYDICPARSSNEQNSGLLCIPIKQKIKIM